MPLSIIALRGLSVARICVGSSSLLLPVHVGPLFGIPINANAAIMARLFGIRDLLMGLYLWKTTSGYFSQTSLSNVSASKAAAADNNSDSISLTELRRRELRTALMFGLICDSVDVLSSVGCILEGNLTDLAKIGVMGGAALFATVGTWQVRAL